MGRSNRKKKLKGEIRTRTLPPRRGNLSLPPKNQPMVLEEIGRSEQRTEGETRMEEEKTQKSRAKTEGRAISTSEVALTEASNLVRKMCENEGHHDEETLRLDVRKKRIQKSKAEMLQQHGKICTF